MKLFWNTNDYNLILENILDSKYFSANSKSLLLSMFYKIENFYNDYKTVKNIDKSKNEYLQEILEIVKKYCDNIKLIEPDTKEAEVLKENNVLALTNEKERSILAYPTEMALFFAISDVVPKYFYVPDNFMLKNSLQMLLVNGYNENNLEIISDFNGWSWDVNLQVKNSPEDNLIYQNLIILFGLEFMDNWMKASDIEANQLEYIKNNVYDTKFYDCLCDFLKFETTDKDKKKLEKSIESKKKELEIISNKPKYFEDIKKNKMKCLKELEKIDILLNDKKALKNIDKKTLEIKKAKYLKRIKELTNMVNPINYINHKRDLENSININSNDKDDCLILLEKEFIAVLKRKIEETENTDELKDFIFKIRYYRFLYLNNDKQIKDIDVLNSEVQNVLGIAILKLLNSEHFKKVTTNDELNIEIIKNILDTKIMDLREIRFEVFFKEGSLVVKTYEKEVYEKEFILSYECAKKEFLIKSGKIYKLFI